MIGGFGSLWASIFYYSLEVWPKDETNLQYPNVNTFLMYASGVLMANMILLMITVIFNPIMADCCECAPFLWFVNLFIGGATFLFFLVWSIMGAIWVDKDGLDLSKFYIPWWVQGRFYYGTWFKNATNTTLIFSFVISWFPMVVLSLFGVYACCTLAARTNSEAKEGEDHEADQNQAKKDKLNSFFSKMKNALPSKKNDTDKLDTQKDEKKNEGNVETNNKTAEDEEKKNLIN